MTSLDEWRWAQRNDVPTVSDAQLEAFLAGIDLRAAALDRAAHATDEELRMIGRSRGAA